MAKQAKVCPNSGVDGKAHQRRNPEDPSNLCPTCGAEMELKDVNPTGRDTPTQRKPNSKKA